MEGDHGVVAATITVEVALIVVVDMEAREITSQVNQWSNVETVDARDTSTMTVTTRRETMTTMMITGMVAKGFLVGPAQVKTMTTMPSSLTLVLVIIIPTIEITSLTTTSVVIVFKPPMAPQYRS